VALRVPEQPRQDAAAGRDEVFMRRCLELAAQAGAAGEVPVGAVVVRGDAVIGEGFNLRETRRNPLRHAEIDAIDAAATALGTWRLSDCELFVTLEPCVMCAGAVHQARLKRVVFGALDPKAGAMGSLYRIHADERLNHRLPVTAGVLGTECGEILKEFFRTRRNPR
jgi:tRNA(adenine34) deaminase